MTTYADANGNIYSSLPRDTPVYYVQDGNYVLSVPGPGGAEMIIDSIDVPANTVHALDADATTILDDSRIRCEIETCQLMAAMDLRADLDHAQGLVVKAAQRLVSEMDSTGVTSDTWTELRAYLKAAAAAKRAFDTEVGS